MLIRLHDVLSDALRLENLLDQEVAATQRRVNLLVVLLLAATGLTVTLVLSRIKRTISSSLRTLHRGTEALAAGNLDHRIGLPADDELGRLAGAFDSMTDRLRDTTVSRDALSREVEQRKAAQEALRDGEAQLQTVVENLTEGLVVSDLQGNLLHWNRAALEMHGLASLAEARRKLPEFTAIFELSTLDGAVLAVEDWPLTRILRGEDLRDWEVRIRRLQGDWRRIFNYGGTLVRDEAGMPLMAVVTVGDITQRKAAEQALRESQQDLARAQAVAHIGSWRLDVRRDELRWSDETYRIFGIPPGAPMTYEAFLAAVHPEDRTSVDERWTAALRGEPYDIEHRIVVGDAVRWVREKAQLEFDAEGGLLAGFGAVQDITDRKVAQEALRRARDELELRVAERTAELRQRAEQLAMLASELTLAEQRERRRLAQVLHDHLQQLLVGAKFGLEVLCRRVGESQRPGVEQIQELLDESIRTSRSLTVELSPPILHEAGLGAGLEWLARWMKEKHGLLVELDIDPRAVTDREDVKVLLFQSVRELLFNVVKHAGVTHVRVEMAPQQDGRLCVKVSDRGVGFDPETMWSRSSQMAGGFGLLSIRERLELLGGRLTIESGPQQGARFMLIAPARTAAATQRWAPPAPAARAAPLPPARILPPAEGRIRVMLVDDHAVMRQGLAALLDGERDIQIVGQASDGQQAVELATRLVPDVILMDFSMPHMDGVQATRVIHRELPHIRIIGLSMYEEADRAAAMLEAGAAGYLTKSGDPDSLLGAIRGAR